MAKIISVLNQKGGVGKTTVSVQLGGTLGQRARTVVVDADKQGTARRWISSATKDNPFAADVIALGNADLAKEVKKLMPRYDFIIIDCPPAIESVIPKYALAISDLALIPLVPSPPDLWAGVGIKKLVQQAQQRRPSLLARIVANDCERTNLAKDIIEIMSDYDIPMLSTKIMHRIGYRESVGGTVHDLPSSNSNISAKLEMVSLANEILTLLHVEKKPTEKAIAVN